MRKLTPAQATARYLRDRWDSQDQDILMVQLSPTQKDDLVNRLYWWQHWAPPDAFGAKLIICALIKSLR